MSSGLYLYEVYFYGMDMFSLNFPFGKGRKGTFFCYGLLLRAGDNPGSHFFACHMFQFFGGMIGDGEEEREENRKRADIKHTPLPSQ